MPNDTPGPARMSAEAYRACMDTVAGQAAILATLPIDQALAVARDARDFGPFFLPTEWRLGVQNAEDAIELLEPLLAVRCATERIRERAAARLAKVQERAIGDGG